MPSSQFSKFAATVALLILLSTIAAAQFQIGSSNTAFYGVGECADWG
jgi:hypothetical protein